MNRKTTKAAMSDLSSKKCRREGGREVRGGEEWREVEESKPSSLPPTPLIAGEAACCPFRDQLMNYTRQQA